ncbi:MAG: efflux RND transporter periplasmic adaptor subunit [Candidatus Gastranaerophilales bacterium]|nr:efflux RND transporter periplasmic adaptor subunit [Candidatus Gastranaerophilales bacterium]
MRKNVIVFLLICTAILLAIGAVFSYKQAHTLVLQGEVEVKTVNLSSKLSARINKINVNKGDVVKKGDILVILDAPEVDAKAEQSQAMLALALAQQEKVNNGNRQEMIAIDRANYEVMEKTYTRMKNLHAEGVIPTQKLDEATAKYKAAKEKYEMTLRGARIEDKVSAAAVVNKAKGATDEVSAYLKENKIIAPSDGIITEIPVEEGELVGAGFPIITLADNNNTWVTFNIREDLLTRIKNGTVLEVRIPALGKETIKVKVNYISVMGNFATWRATKVKGDFDMKTFEVRAVPLEKNENVRAGMSVLFDWMKVDEL